MATHRLPRPSAAVESQGPRTPSADAGPRHEESRGVVTLESPIGRLALIGGLGGIAAVRFDAVGMARWRPCAALEDGARQLEEFFRAERRTFEIPLVPLGTAFQLRVWTAVSAIPFGATRTYGDVAAAIGQPAAARAVGGAVGANPLPILIPCHRVVGCQGILVGYGGGLWRKEWLLRHEGATLL